MRRIALPALLALLFGLLPMTASAIDCRSEKGSGAWWSWRNIDGKRCWYQGRPGMSKDKLRWATPQETKRQEPATKRQEPAAKRQEPKSQEPKRQEPKRQEPKRATVQRQPVPQRQADDERQRLLHSYWPPLPPKESFIERFNAFAPR